VRFPIFRYLLLKQEKHIEDQIKPQEMLMMIMAFSSSLGFLDIASKEFSSKSNSFVLQIIKLLKNDYI